MKIKSLIVMILIIISISSIYAYPMELLHHGSSHSSYGGSYKNNISCINLGNSSLVSVKFSKDKSMKIERVNNFGCKDNDIFIFNNISNVTIRDNDIIITCRSLDYILITDRLDSKISGSCPGDNITLKAGISISDSLLSRFNLYGIQVSTDDWM